MNLKKLRRVQAQTSTLSRCLRLILLVSVLLVTCVSVEVNLLHKEEKKVYPRDTVILHQIGRGPFAPSMTPFGIKLETYLRIARIPYQNVHSFTHSYKGKFPWIEYNGEAIADSTLCIDFLNKTLGVDLNKHLRPAEKGIAQSMQVLVEEHLYWKVTKMVWAQGLGRHTEEEVTQMMFKDLQALSDFLGQKKFMMGDNPSEVDCPAFGQLSQFYWQFIGTGHDTIIKDNYPNLAAYCERMKTTFWQDWDEHTGRSKESTKVILKKNSIQLMF